MVIPHHKPIVLLGFMGSGKSTLGKQLASSLGWIFLDLDRFIEIEENRTIAQIFEQHGEAEFRKLESRALAKVIAHPHQVISIGGGAPCQKENLELIKKSSLSVYLKISIPQLCLRLGYSSTSRPLLKGKTESETLEFITELLAVRDPYYSQAEIIIESDNITTEMILSKLNWSTQ